MLKLQLNADVNPSIIFRVNTVSSIPCKSGFVSGSMDKLDINAPSIPTFSDSDCKNVIVMHRAMTLTKIKEFMIALNLIILDFELVTDLNFRL